MRKGRTYRKRKRFKNPQSVPLNSTEEIVSLTKWIKINGFRVFKKLKLVDFPLTGRGVMAMENIHSGDVIMEVPLRTLINIVTLESDEQFKNIIYSDSFTCLRCPKFSCQELLSLYLSYLKICGKHSHWSTFISSLPNDLSMPYFYLSPSLKDLDESMFDIVHLQKVRVQDSFLNIQNMLKASVKKDQFVHEFCSKFTFPLYEWAYFIVNSRCVYVDPDLIERACSITAVTESSILNILSDRPNSALVPYLDMFNHSATAKTQAILAHTESVSKNLYSSCNLASAPFSFTLRVLTDYKKFEQIFISYGEHCNVKLLTEYGFILPHNPVVMIKFSFMEISNFLKSNASNYSISDEKYKFIRKHQLCDNIYVDKDGLNYNFLRFLYTIVNEDKTVQVKKIYSMNFNSVEYEKMIAVGILLIDSKIECFKRKLVRYLENSTANDCSVLIEEYISILSIVSKKLKLNDNTF